ncbi:MAG TPA: GNAT family N-acetyltransferase [Vicinamibacterales bacterium]
MTDHVHIRPAVEADVPLIHEFIRELAQYERLLDQVVATEDDLRTTLFGPRPYAEVLIAESRGRALGFALFFHNYSTFLGRPGLYLEDLFVRADARGQGIGRRLLSAVAAVAVARGCGRLDWAVLNWNEPAIGFYRRMGAVMQEDWRVFRLTGEALARVAREHT